MHDSVVFCTKEKKEAMEAQQAKEDAFDKANQEARKTKAGEGTGKGATETRAMA